MKAFVIKNKKGKYFCGFDYFAGVNIFSERIIDGLNTQTPTLKHCREEIKDFDLKDCNPVKITIEEGDLEQQLAENENALEYYFGLSQAQITEIDTLKQKLAEKDKELAELRKEFKSLQEFNRNTNMQLKNYKSKLYGVDDIRKLREMRLTPEEKKLYIKGFEMCERQIATNIADLTLKIRHQVCEEIRKLEIRHRYDGDTNSVIDGYFVDKEKLDQIEQGESDGQ